jgi:hypothetical protein
MSSFHVLVWSVVSRLQPLLARLEPVSVENAAAHRPSRNPDSCLGLWEFMRQARLNPGSWTRPGWAGRAGRGNRGMAICIILARCLYSPNSLRRMRHASVQNLSQTYTVALPVYLKNQSLSLCRPCRHISAHPDWHRPTKLRCFLSLAARQSARLHNRKMGRGSRDAGDMRTDPRSMTRGSFPFHDPLANRPQKIYTPPPGPVNIVTVYPPSELSVLSPSSATTPTAYRPTRPPSGFCPPSPSRRLDPRPLIPGALVLDRP